ncbi:hypothetical protein [Acinetobacter haemolyticus]|uniref:hypothetical protein n=1 Tax=Acinetobacter haemolyticus TaxID=29430 RepID=UPI001372DDBE|nr:hypothetical protein [Acinetobacter haemolyticus]NAR85837.1 hypothetical protein [Acinetobacter haemolyticus]NAR89845.1 hypothetical protein [Acinetobacter haemolyticus]
MTTYNVLHLNAAIACMHGIPAGASTCISSLQQNVKRISSRPSIEMLKHLTDKDGVKHAHPTKFAATLSETIGFAQQMPQFNGQIQVCLSPLVQAFKNLGLSCFNVNQAFNPHFFQEVLMHFQINVQTRVFAEHVQSWTALSVHTAKAYDKVVKTLLKNVNGFDLYELIICTPLNPNLLPNLKVTSQTQYSRTLDKEITQLICKNEINEICMVMCKSEININQQYVDRYIIAVKRQYIDDKHKMEDCSFVHDIRALIKLRSNSKVYFQSCSLNGFLATPRFMSSNPQLKMQIKQLKTYLVGTDTLVRLHADQPSLRILYTKF